MHEGSLGLSLVECVEIISRNYDITYSTKDIEQFISTNKTINCTEQLSG